MSADGGKRLSVVGLLAVAALILSVSPAFAVVTATLSSEGLLSVTTSGDDSIEITCDGLGNVKINGVDPNTGTAPCTAVVNIQVSGGIGSNTVNLSAVTPALFPTIGTAPFAGEFSISIAGLNDGDSLTGGPFPEILIGGPGNDLIDGGGGADRLVFFGSPGNDTITATDSAGILTAGSETDKYSSIERFSLFGQTGDDVLRGARAGTTV